MKDARGNTIYVGKAKDLHRRLGNYFSPTGATLSNHKTRALINAIASFDYFETRNDQEAFLLESKLIKHAFDGYPKVRTGKFTVFETQEEPQDIDYGLEQTTVIQPNQPGQQPQPLQTQSENPLQEFGEQPQAEPVPASGITTPISQEDEDAGF